MTKEQLILECIKIVKPTLDKECPDEASRMSDSYVDKLIDRAEYMVKRIERALQK